MNRRGFLAGISAALGASALPIPAVAAVDAAPAVLAWVHFNGDDGLIMAASPHNPIRSIVRNGVGDYTINFERPILSGNPPLLLGRAA